MNVRPLIKTAILSLRVTQPVKDALQQAALVDHRPVGNLVEKLIVDWLSTAGFLKAGRGSPSGKQQRSSGSTRTRSATGSKRDTSKHTSRAGEVVDS